LSKDKKVWLAAISCFFWAGYPAKHHIPAQRKIASCHYHNRCCLTFTKNPNSFQFEYQDFKFPATADLNELTVATIINQIFTCNKTEFTCDEPTRAPPFKNCNYCSMI
jgi:hypothetical protein